MRVDFVCETCGFSGHRSYQQGRVPQHFFRSVPCQNEWQKTRQDLQMKNRDPKFRAKVSAGLKRRKERLGDNYHSPETKARIGTTTREHWASYDECKRSKLIATLRSNAQKKRTFKPYDYEWQLLSKRLREDMSCARCGSRESLTVHHIVPVKQGSTAQLRNLAVLCRSCHPKVEKQTHILHSLLPDYDVLQLLARERLGLCL